VEGRGHPEAAGFRASISTSRVRLPVSLAMVAFDVGLRGALGACDARGSLDRASWEVSTEAQARGERDGGQKRGSIRGVFLGA